MHKVFPYKSISLISIKISLESHTSQRLPLDIRPIARSLFKARRERTAFVVHLGTPQKVLSEFKYAI